MGKRVLTVLRSGGEYTPAHVQVMAGLIKKWAPGAYFRCLSDVEIPGVERIHLTQNWPGWYAKLEMFREDIGGDFLYTDLDNLPLGPLDDFFPGKFITQRGGWNALTYIPKGGFPELFEEFKHAPGEHMAQHLPNGISGKPFGDAGFVSTRIQGECWEDLIPGQVVNISEIHIRAPWPFKRTRNPIPEDARMILCSAMYGRPWDIPEFKDLYR